MTQLNFDILSRDVSVHRSRVVEASAGTGKTFAIENLVLRLLIEDDPLTGEPLHLEQILAVTFTRAATRDLKKRIRSNLDKAWNWLNSLPSPAAPAFIQAIQEKGPEACQKAARRLEYALATFDQAQIFTIHGFCARMLVEHHLDALAGHTQEELSPAFLLRITKDFLRTEVRTERISPFQLQKVLEIFRADEDAFQRALLNQATKTIPITAPEDFTFQLNRFKNGMARLKQRAWNAEKLRADWNALCSGLRSNKEQALREGEAWILLITQDHWSAIDFDALLRNESVMEKFFTKPLKKLPRLHYPEWVETVRSELLDIVLASSDPNRIFTWLASHCQQLVGRVLEEEEIRGADRLLADMAAAVEDPTFRQLIRQRYRAAVVDEFQDTDPQQWTILKALFPADSGTYLTVVGDPKQSIYAFRQADIYTYRQAAQNFTEQGRLSTNYRSQPGLVRALNTLFNCPGFIALPKSNIHLDPGAVEPSPQATNHPFQDPLKPIHFLIAKGTISSRAKSFPNQDFETTLLYSRIAQEIVRLHSEEKFQWNQIAVLVRDRHQGKALLDYLKRWNIPAATQRSESLLDSEILPATIELLQGFLTPKDKSPLKCVLGGLYIGWNHARLKDWAENLLIGKEDLLLQAQKLHYILLNEGFSPFLEAFLHSSWPDTTVIENMLAREDGRRLYRDLRQLGDLMTQQQAQKHLSAQGLLQWLLQLKETASEEEDTFKVWDDPALDAVRLMTIHYSKGLEFDIVFTLGLIRRSSGKEIMISNDNRLEAVINGSETLIAHQKENDAEKARLAYVALTRAKTRVYAPVAFGTLLTEGQKAKPGNASAMELLTARLGRPFLENEALYDSINSEDLGSNFLTFLHTHADIFSYEITEEVPIQPVAGEAAPQLIAPDPIELNFPSLLTHSFTSMAHKTSVEEQDAPAAPQDYKQPLKTVHTLPAGKKIGIALHEIFEQIPFTSVNTPQDVEPHVPAWLGDWTPVMADLVYHTLHAPLPLPTGPFCLHHLTNNKKLIEWEFLIPIHDGFIKGFVDLIFEHEGLYYLVDWKSNWLGTTAEAYTQTSLQSAMQAENYDLQLQIYTEALRRYFEKIDSRPFEEYFGGAFYLFSRGMAEGKGIYYTQPVKPLDKER